ERYLVNSWIENSAGQKEKTFIVTPPLFVSEPKSENTLRIIYATMVYAKMSSLDPSPGGSYAYARRCFGPFLGYQTNVLYWLACW
ncbi:fimbria/pilus periplasmic chaperone, partial [Salmonella enterica subsp. enterica serovar Kentucky]|nr:fimbria/pilus periplasmic chaperone [Salmonella enterica subsp. enterica serovar Kentucky]